MTRPVTILFHKNDNRQLKKKKRKKKKRKKKRKKKQIEREGETKNTVAFLTRAHKSWPLH